MSWLKQLVGYFDMLTKKPHLAMLQFSIGSIVFFIAMLGIYAVEHYVMPSLEQELYALGCTSIAAMSFLIAFSAYLCIMISRFRN